MKHPKQLVAIKLFKENGDTCDLPAVLDELAAQTYAHSIIGLSCPSTLGLLHILPEFSYEGFFEYAIVTEFVSVVEGSVHSVTVDEAIRAKIFPEHSWYVYGIVIYMRIGSK